MRRSDTTLFVAVLTLLPASVRAAHEDHQHAVPEKLGHVKFSISCQAGARASVEHGLALLHSFAYEQAGKAFADASARDPACGIAQWGIAMSNLHIIWAPPTDIEFAAGRAAAEKAAALGATARERDYIAAIGAYYKGDGVAHPARVAAYADAMAGVAKRNPDDHEAQIFYALSILGVAYNSPPDKTYARQKQAAEILKRMLAVEP